MGHLWDVLFPTSTVWDLSSCVGTHDGMLEVLRTTYDQLPSEDVVEMDPVSASSGAKSRAKMRTADDDSEVRSKKKLLHRMPVYNLVEVPPLTLDLFAGVP